MLTESQLKKLVRDATGLDDPNEAFEETLKIYIEQKLHYYREVIERLEDKYGLTFEEFSKKLGKELPLIWKNEQDYMAWEEAITNIEHFEKVSSQLRVHA